ncbi:MAG: hypothetical protein Q7T96_18305 [Methylobacter sp.]|nr:hypothetical protein [Methylobacter sp.]
MQWHPGIRRCGKPLDLIRHVIKTTGDALLETFVGRIDRYRLPGAGMRVCWL